jgi:hypothetical protein
MTISSPGPHCELSIPTFNAVNVTLPRKTADCDVVIPFTPADGANYQNMFLRDQSKAAKSRLVVLVDLMCAAYKKGIEDGR